MRLVQQLDDAVAVDGIERVGKPNVLHAGLSEHLGFTELGATDANGSLTYLALRERDAFMCLGVGTEPESASRCGGLHSVKVLRHPRVVHEHARRPEVSDFHTVSVNAILTVIYSREVQIGVRPRFVPLAAETGPGPLSGPLWEQAERLGAGEAGEDAGGVAEAQVAPDDFVEHRAEVGGD